jgi:protein-S-isoprenylcysteine O-methyltransferase Ste14
MAAGIMLRGAAIGQLGRQFTSEGSRPGGGGLVQTGLYAWMRHPSETGLLLIAAGAALLMGGPLAGLLCAVLLLPLALVRIHLEENVLRETYGAEFDHYRSRTPALAPATARNGAGVQPGRPKSKA